MSPMSGLENRLRASEESYRTIFDSSYDAMFVHDLATGAIIDANRAACELSGATREELLTRGIEIIGSGPPPFTPDHALDFIGRAAAGEPQRFEWCSTHPLTGEEVWVEVGLQKVTIDAQDRLLAVVRDIRERKLAERALIASEQAYRAIFQHSAEAIWIHDVETGAMLDVNQAGCDMYGYTRDDMLRLGHDALLYPGTDYTAERVGEVMKQAMAGMTPRFEWLGLHRDGSATWGEVTLRRVNVGGIDRILATVRDIRARKEAEQALLAANEELERRVEERTAELAEANMALEEEIAEHEAAREQLLDAERTLREREEHFRRLIESSHDLIQMIDAQGRITYSSPSVQRLLGYTTDEVTALGIGEFVHPDDQAMAYGAVGEVMANPGHVVELEYRVRHRNGTYRWFQAVARTLSPDTAEHGLLANARDITEHRAAQEALRRSEEHFRKLIENSSDYIMVVDETAAITYVGPSSERLLGWRPDEMMGNRPSDLVHPDDVDNATSAVARIIANPGMVVTTEYRIRHRDGSWRAFEGVGRTLSPDSAADGIVANCRDITDRRAAEQALREARVAAETANQAKSEFLSRMSHELRTPMNSILGFAQVLEGGTLDDRQERCVQHILRAGRHLLQLINEVLEISRIEAGRHNLSLEPVRIASVLHEAVALARPMAAQSRVAVEFRGDPPEDVFVRGDRQRLSQVMLNLLSNSIKYNRAGGWVRVRCDQVQGPDGTARLQLRVQDTGRGIAPERQKDLFTPFARLGAEDSGVEGTGLGLALSQRLAEAMGGRLELERSMGEGSTFLLELQETASPLEQAEEASAARRPAGTAPHRAATLLYIEDNLANLSLVETILWERPSWKTIPALQGQIGVELAREHEPDLVLLDLHLPDIRGEEVLRRLREDDRTARIPVVVISADATPDTAERLLAAGAVAFMTKPLDVAEFLATLERLLQVEA
jgi:PAS domain S-box-containing protein